MNKGKIKILHAIRQGRIGGGETHVLDLVHELNKDNFESIVLAFTDGPLISSLNELGIKTHIILTEKPFDINVWKAIRILMEEENIDILHAHGTRALSNTFRAAKKLKIPIIYTVHGWSFHPNQNMLMKKVRVWSEKYLVGKADITICVSNNNLSEGRTNFKIDRAVVIKNGINFRKFDANNTYREIRKDFNISPDTLLIGYIARITIQKDPFTFIRAVAKISNDSDIKFLIIGDGDLKKSAVELAVQLKIDHKIIFSGFRQDIPDVLNAIDVYCLPSLWEGLPIGLLEAMAMRKATISTSVNGTKEVIAHGKNGLLIEPGDAEGLASAIMMLKENVELRKSLAIEAEASAKKDYSVSEMTFKIETLYKNLVSEL